MYEVEPLGEFENDPNVTNKRFAGNPTRSQRSAEPLRVVAEVTDWTRLTPEQLQGWLAGLVRWLPGFFRRRRLGPDCHLEPADSGRRAA